MRQMRGVIFSLDALCSGSQPQIAPSDARFRLQLRRGLPRGNCFFDSSQIGQQAPQLQIRLPISRVCLQGIVQDFHVLRSRRELTLRASGRRCFQPLRRVGRVDHSLVGAALAAGVKVFPAATSSNPIGRAARLEIGQPSRSPRRRRGPLTELELADQVGRDIELLLAELGDLRTGTPLDWLPLTGIGGA